MIGKGGVLLYLNGILRTPAQVAERFAAKAKETREGIAIANKRASIVIYQWVLRNFQTEGELAGGWPPLAPATIAWKSEHGYARVLQNTGALRASFLPYADDKIAAVGSALWYSVVHQEGSARVPQRRILPNEEETGKIALEIYGREMKIVSGRKL